MTSEQVQDLLSQVIRLGFVTARDPGRLRVRVECRDTVTEALVTDWLHVLVARAKEDLQYDLPDVGDQVMCLFLPHGREKGVVLGSMYAADAPPVTSGDKWHRAFKDGTSFEYDREENKLTAQIKGNGVIDVESEGLVTIKAKGAVLIQSTEGITLKAPTIMLAGNLMQEGYEGGAATSELRGSFTVREGGVSVPDQDVIAGSVALRKHIHDGVESGADTSDSPVGG